MRLINISGVDCTIEGVTVGPGQVSPDLPDDIAREIAGNRGVFAIAPESEHEPEELAHADEPANVRVVVKPEPEEPAKPLGRPAPRTTR